MSLSLGLRLCLLRLCLVCLCKRLGHLLLLLVLVLLLEMQL